MNGDEDERSERGEMMKALGVHGGLWRCWFTESEMNSVRD